MNTKFIATIGVIAVLLAAIGFFATSKSDRKSTVDDLATLKSGEAFIPGLKDKLEDISKIELIGPKEKLTVLKQDKGWVLAESDGYASREDSIRNLLMDLGALKKLEAKTANPDLYSRIGVEDSPKDDSDSKTIKLYDKSGAEVASVIVGKDDYGSAEEGKGPNKFVRKSGDKQSWLAAGNVRSYLGKANWVKADFLDIPVNRIKSVDVKHKDGEHVEIVKADEKSANYELKTLPAGRELKDAMTTSEASRVLATLRFDDVKKRESLKLSDADTSATTTIRTFDGLVFNTAVHHLGDKDYVTFNVSADDAAITAENDARKAQHEKDKAAAAAQTPAPTPAPVEGQPTPTPAPSPTPVPEPTLIEADKIKKEAEDLNAQLSPWAFQLAGYYRDRLMRRNEFFLKPLPKEGEATATPAPGKAAMPDLGTFDLQSMMEHQGAK
ncbi:DUF4340 domain-containing protein [Candidatus Sumerlaeota bacterium]|nr:DUF4340 domain-containing protein [Candidatus Sumerlaeota bacterium]